MMSNSSKLASPKRLMLPAPPQLHASGEREPELQLNHQLLTQHNQLDSASGLHQLTSQLLLLVQLTHAHRRQINQLAQQLLIANGLIQLLIQLFQSTQQCLPSRACQTTRPRWVMMLPGSNALPTPLPLPVSLQTALSLIPL